MLEINKKLYLRFLQFMAVLFTLIIFADSALAHSVTQGDKGYIEQVSGIALIPYAYLGAKHMITGYDHLLFLFGVIFFLYRLSQVTIYVTLFALGHSITMILGVYFEISINAYLIDAVIGLSIVYKALDNLGAYRRWFGFQPNTKAATILFGLFHGFGLATKILDFEMDTDALLPNLLAFNIGVEIGQILALGLMLIIFGFWRKTRFFIQHAYAANVVLITLGFMLAGYQITGYFVV